MGLADFQQLVNQGLVWSFVVVFGAGLATSLTPCVYPMIPITVSIFGARQARGRGGAFLLATAYVMGIATMYTVLGVIAGLTGWAAGSLLASPWFVVPLAALFLALASAMFGLWEIRLPHRLSARLSMVGGKGLHGAFAMGLVGGILIAPCTGPILAGLLAYIALTRNVVLGGSLLFTYALGIGVLFWILATFSVRLPRGGRWMEVVKSLLGIPLVVGALYFLQNVIPQLARYSTPSRAFALGNVALVVGGIALGALHLSYHGASVPSRLRKMVGILLMAVGLFGLVNFSVAPPEKLAWIHREREALALAKADRRPVLIDFWAQWCRPCKEMEARILGAPAVRRELQRFVLFKVDVTDDTERDRRLKRKYRADELPQLVVLDTRGDIQARAGKVHDVQSMLRLLRSIR